MKLDPPSQVLLPAGLPVPHLPKDKSLYVGPVFKMDDVSKNELICV